MKVQKYSEPEWRAENASKQRTALIMTTMFPTRVPTPTPNSDGVSTRGEVVEEHTAACSKHREVLTMLRFAGRGRRQASPTPCPNGAPTRLPRTNQPSARDSRHRVTVPCCSASSSRDPQSATNAIWSPQWSLHTQLSAGSFCAPVNGLAWRLSLSEVTMA